MGFFILWIFAWGLKEFLLKTFISSMLHLQAIGCFLNDRQIKLSLINSRFFFPSSIKHQQTLKRTITCLGGSLFERGGLVAICSSRMGTYWKGALVKGGIQGFTVIYEQIKNHQPQNCGKIKKMQLNSTNNVNIPRQQPQLGSSDITHPIFV